MIVTEIGNANTTIFINATSNIPPPIWKTKLIIALIHVTSHDFTDQLERAEIQISAGNRCRALGNIIVERLWRTVRQENIYVNGCASPREANLGLHHYFRFYNEEHPRQPLGYCTPE